MMTKTKPDVPKQNRKDGAEGRKMFLLILPFLILCFLFSYFPLHGWIYALYDYRAPLKLSQCEFVGLKWFATLFRNPTQVQQLLTVMKNTFAMSILGLATSFFPVLFAVFLNEVKCKWFKNVVQTLTTLPNFISWTVSVFHRVLPVFRYGDVQHGVSEPGADLRASEDPGQRGARMADHASVEYLERPWLGFHHVSGRHRRH